MGHADKASNIYFSAFNNDLSKKKKSKKSSKKKKKKPVKLEESKSIKIYLQKGNDEKTRFQLPINPTELMPDRRWNNQKININNRGDVLLIGKRQLITVELSSYFPAHWSSICMVGKSKLKTPEEYDDIFAQWQGKQIRFITVGPYTHINLLCVIDSYKSGFKDGTNDIYYEATLCEYRKKAKSNGKKKRSSNTKKKSVKTVKTKKGDTLRALAKRYLGSASKWETLYKKNKTALDRMFSRQRKRLLQATKRARNPAKEKAAYSRWCGQSKGTRSLDKNIKLKIR